MKQIKYCSICGLDFIAENEEEEFCKTCIEDAKEKYRKNQERWGWIGERISA